MSQFDIDNNYQLSKRARLMTLYDKIAHDRHYVFCDKGQLAEHLQAISVDVIMQKKAYFIQGIEEKTVRWPGYVYEHFSLETDSCTVLGRLKKGWMYTCKADVLLYSFEQADRSLASYWIPFRPLQEWFFKDDNFRNYGWSITNQINMSKTRKVDIKDVQKNIEDVQVYLI